MLRAVLGNRGHIYGEWETRRGETARHRGSAGRHNLSAESSALTLIPSSLADVLGDSWGELVPSLHLCSHLSNQMLGLHDLLGSFPVLISDKYLEQFIFS